MNIPQNISHLTNNISSGLSSLGNRAAFWTRTDATKREFDILDHTADVGIRAYGSKMGEAYANAAKAMFSIITNLEQVQGSLHRDVEVTALDREALLVEWLNELIFLFDVEHLLFNKFDIVLITDKRIKARCYGEKVDKSRHELKIGIKAATYHMLKVESDTGKEEYQIQVLLDV
jgi:SHS2 domain-containing protein